MKFKKTERGQSLVELSISLTFMLFVLAGVVEFGMAFFQFIQLRDAAQEGALYGSIHPTDTNGIISRVRYSSSSPVDLTNTTTVTVPPPTIIGSACEGNSLQIDVYYDHVVFMPFMSQILGPKRTLHATVIDTILSPMCP